MAAWIRGWDGRAKDDFGAVCGLASSMSFGELGGVSFCGLVGFTFLLESPHWKSAGTAWLVGVDWQGVQYRFCGGLLARDERRR